MPAEVGTSLDGHKVAASGTGGRQSSRAWVLLVDGADKCVVDLKLKTKSGVNFGGRVNLCQHHIFVYRGQS